MGHGDLLVTQTYTNQEATTAPSASRVASAARAASFKRGSRELFLVMSAIRPETAKLHSLATHRHGWASALAI